MKKLLLLFVVFACTANFAEAQKYAKLDKSVLDAVYYPTNAPKRAFAKTPDEQISLTPKIRVLYSRPAKKGRNIFGELLPYGDVWRVGANESTEILFMTDVKIGGVTIKAGRYSMVAIPNADNWKISINSDLDGCGNYTHNPKKDIASVTVPVQGSDAEIELLSITMYEKTPGIVLMNIGWDRTFVELPIELL